MRYEVEGVGGGGEVRVGSTYTSSVKQNVFI